MMETGAFAMFDALGIRGIWEKHDPDAIVQKLEHIADQARAIIDWGLGGEGHPNTRKDGNFIKNVRAGFLSDTVVVGFANKENQHPVFALMMAAQYAGEVIRLGLEEPAPWTYRGVVTFGEFAIHQSGNFYVGPAVDEAAHWYEQANAALIWFTPSARTVMDGASKSEFQGATTTLEYEIPLKQKGDSSWLCQRVPWHTPRRNNPRTYVVSPFESRTPATASEIATRMVASFDVSKPGVLEKRRNTESFLRLHLAEHAKIWEDKQASLKGLGY